MDVTVCICTYGDYNKWKPLVDRAEASVYNAKVVMKIHRNEGTLASVRNLALKLTFTEYVCFLDADDELTPDYFERIEEAGEADIRAPAVSYYTSGVGNLPHVPYVRTPYGPRQDGPALEYGNWIVIGAVARTKLLKDVGGFREWPMYEDWDLWLRCWQHGCSVIPVTNALYVAHVNEGSRNRGPSKEAKLEAHRAIARRNGVHVP